MSVDRINLAATGWHGTDQGVSEIGTGALMWLTTLNTTLLKDTNTPLIMHS